MGDNRVDDRVGIREVPKNVELGNDGIGNNAGNQDNWHAIVKDIEDSDDVVVDPIDRVLADVLAYSFGPLSPKSNLPLGVTTAYSV